MTVSVLVVDDSGFFRKRLTEILTSSGQIKVVGAATNGLITQITDPIFILPLRFATGFFLAGIYPVGMKIASDYHQKGLGVALGYLVGALVIGTAFPHLLKNLFADFPWQNVVLTASGMAVLGGLIVGLGVKDGPYQKRNTQFEPASFITIFSIPKLNAMKKNIIKKRGIKARERFALSIKKKENTARPIEKVRANFKLFLTNS